jgi:hypothetical protein
VIVHSPIEPATTGIEWADCDTSESREVHEHADGNVFHCFGQVSGPHHVAGAKNSCPWRTRCRPARSDSPPAPTIHGKLGAAEIGLGLQNFGARAQTLFELADFHFEEALCEDDALAGREDASASPRQTIGGRVNLLADLQNALIARGELLQSSQQRLAQSAAGGLVADGISRRSRRAVIVEFVVRTIANESSQLSPRPLTL